jgi:transposase
MAMKKNFILFDQVVERGAGMDVHKETIVVTIQGKGIKTETKSFRTFTSSLKKLREWLKQHGITHLAMESTGVYWKPVFNVLGDDFMIILVNARHVKNVPGHKTDKQDSKWLAKLLLSGLLKGSFIPGKEIRDLRDLVRTKTQLTGEISSAKNRFIKFMESANIKLSSVLTDVFCVTGQKIIAEILDGDYKPERLLYHVHGRVKASRQDIIEALTGNLDEHYRFMMKIMLEHIANIENVIAKIDAQIMQKTEDHKEILELLETIPGVGRDGAICIVAEIGTNMEAFASHKHLASWAGMCPGNNESAGKNKSGRITYGNAFLRTFLVQMAWAAARTKNTYLSSKYKSLVGRRGKKKAVIAVGHKILIAAYFIMKNKVGYNELGEEYLNNFRRDKLINYYKNQLQKLDPNVNFDKEVA